MVAPADQRYTYRDYLELEKRSERKHEFLGGRIFATSGGTPEHGRLAARVIALFEGQLAGRRCVTFTSDVRIYLRDSGIGTYPDVSVVCGKIEHDAADPDAITNPKVIVEVLSKSSEAYDREEKFAHYRRIASLGCYVLVSQEERRVEVLSRNADGTWTLRDVREGEARIAGIDCTLPIEELYRNPLES